MKTELIVWLSLLVAAVVLEVAGKEASGLWLILVLWLVFGDLW